MSISAVAGNISSAPIYRTAEAIGSGARTTPQTVSSPTGTNDVKGFFSPSGIVATASDIQNQVAGINRLIEGASHIDWAHVAEQDGEGAAVAGKQQLLQSFQLAESATIAYAGEQGVVNVDFNFVSPGSSNSAASASSSLAVPATGPGATSATGTGTLSRQAGEPTSASTTENIALALLKETSSSNSSATALSLSGRKHDVYA